MWTMYIVTIEHNIQNKFRKLKKKTVHFWIVAYVVAVYLSQWEIHDKFQSQYHACADLEEDREGPG